MGKKTGYKKQKGSKFMYPCSSFAFLCSNRVLNSLSAFSAALEAVSVGITTQFGHIDAAQTRNQVANDFSVT
jgi:hypothetical protein